ncbi:MAG: transposase [Gammaproteobacteria bacterium]|nr:transposase [Gammaproteobacteria bacterium]
MSGSGAQYRNAKYQDKYRAPSMRLQDYDYGQNGAYFVTICTAKKACCFGNVVNNSTVETRFIASPSQGEQRYQMQYSELGVIAQKYWEDIPQHFAFVELGERVVMPNHVHGVLMFDHEIQVFGAETPRLGVSTKERRWRAGVLGVVINQYKRACTIVARNINPNFSWQSRFYDHVIRNYEDLQRVSEYIINNPQSWEEDDYFMYG